MEHRSYQQTLGLDGLRIVCGSHAGVDRAALDAALARGLQALESPRSVRDSQATLILTVGALDRGARLAAEIAERIGRPFIVIPLEAADALERVRAWLAEVRPQVLNIAGSRESFHPGIYGRAFAFLSRVLRPYAP